jgi:hypothetical protein
MCHISDTAMMQHLQQCKNGARCKLAVDQDRCLTHWLGLSAVAPRLTASQATVACVCQFYSNRHMAKHICRHSATQSFPLTLVRHVLS